MSLFGKKEENQVEEPVEEEPVEEQEDDSTYALIVTYKPYDSSEDTSEIRIESLSMQKAISLKDSIKKALIDRLPFLEIEIPETEDISYSYTLIRAESVYRMDIEVE